MEVWVVHLHLNESSAHILLERPDGVLIKAQRVIGDLDQGGTRGHLHFNVEWVSWIHDEFGEVVRVGNWDLELSCAAKLNLVVFLVFALNPLYENTVLYFAGILRYNSEIVPAVVAEHGLTVGVLSKDANITNSISSVIWVQLSIPNWVIRGGWNSTWKRVFFVIVLADKIQIKVCSAWECCHLDVEVTMLPVVPFVHFGKLIRRASFLIWGHSDCLCFIGLEFRHSLIGAIVSVK